MAESSGKRSIFNVALNSATRNKNRSVRAHSTPLVQPRLSLLDNLKSVERARASSHPNIVVPPHLINPKPQGITDTDKDFSITQALAHGSKHRQSIVTYTSGPGSEVSYGDPKKSVCNMCADPLPDNDDGGYVPCECSFRMCNPCLEHVRKYEKNRCPRCMNELCDKETWLALNQNEEEEEQKGRRTSAYHNLLDKRHSVNIREKTKNGEDPRISSSEEPVTYEKRLQMVPAAIENVAGKSLARYGYGTAAWDVPPSKDHERATLIADIKKRCLSRKLNYPASKMGPYRILVFIRFISAIGFLEYRLTNPTIDGYWLWIVAVMCEIWFLFSWVLDTLPKLTPVWHETYKDRLKAIYDNEEDLPQVDIFITTADAQKEPPFVTACTILSVLALDYPAKRFACYLSDDGSSKLMFDTMAEVAGFAQLWIPFCKNFDIEPRNPDAYFSERIDFTKDKVQPDFVRCRRKVKREFEEFKVRINALVAEGRHPPADGWQMKDGTYWPGNNRRDHDGIIQVFLHPDGDLRDIEGNIMPPLVYVSREKRPGHEHNKKAGAMNALVRASALITNGLYLLNLDCDHFVNNSQAIREALCFFLDPVKGQKIGYVQFPQRFDGIDKNDRYANRNTVFFDINMKGLDGQQGPVYVGTGCMFRRKALYGYYPSNCKTLRWGNVNTGKSLFRTVCDKICCCFGSERKQHARVFGLDDAEIDSEGEGDEMNLIENRKTSKSETVFKMGTCVHFISTVTLAGNGDPPLSPRTMLSDIILAISSDYEDNTDWGKEVGWMYGSVTEDILTGMKVHTRGWRSVYCDPQRAAFKGSAPLNLTDRLHQVERWATGAVEIFFSGRNPLWAQWGTKLKLRQRIAYANNAFYPFTSIVIFAYCLLGPLALMADTFFVPTLDTRATIWFGLLILSIIASSLLELQWSGVTFDAWWRNEQFWVIAGISSHLAAVVQGILKLVAGLEISFTLTSKGSDEEEVDELHTFKFTWLLLLPAFVLSFNILGIVVGVARVATSGGSWGALIAKLVFSCWVIIHLYPFAKGMLGKRDRLPTIVIVWFVLFLIIISLVWTTFFKPGSTDRDFTP